MGLLFEQWMEMSWEMFCNVPFLKFLGLVSGQSEQPGSDSEGGICRLVKSVESRLKNRQRLAGKE